MNSFVDAAVILLLLGVALSQALLEPLTAPAPLAASLAACWLAVVTPALVRSDLERRRLPNVLTLPALMLVVGAAAISWITATPGQDPALALGILGGVALVGVVGAARGGVGLGDVKLGAALAGSVALLDVAALPVLAGVTAVAGLVAALALRLREHPLGIRRRLRRVILRRAERSCGRVSASQVARPGPEEATASGSGPAGAPAVVRPRAAPRCATPVTGRGFGLSWAGAGGPGSAWPEAAWPEAVWPGAYWPTAVDGYWVYTPDPDADDFEPGSLIDDDFDDWRAALQAEPPAPRSARRDAAARFGAWYDPPWIGTVDPPLPPSTLQHVAPGLRSRTPARRSHPGASIVYGPCLLAGYWCALASVHLPGWLTAGAAG